MCFRGAFGIHTQVAKLCVATTASILRVLVGCIHVLWLVLYVVTNSVLWMLPRGPPPKHKSPRGLKGRRIATASPNWGAELGAAAKKARV